MQEFERIKGGGCSSIRGIGSPNIPNLPKELDAHTVFPASLCPEWKCSPGRLDQIALVNFWELTVPGLRQIEEDGLRPLRRLGSHV